MKRVLSEPIALLFLLGILVVSLIDLFSLSAYKAESERPNFSFEALLKGNWSSSFEQWIADGFFARPLSTSMANGMDALQGRLEINGVWLGKDGYLIAKNDTFTPENAKRLAQNTQAITALATRYPDRVGVMIVPSAANMLSAKLRGAPPQRPENTLLDEMYALFIQAGAKTIDLREVLREAADTPLFYRTDHHWTTAGGARLAYEEYARVLRLSPKLPPASLLVSSSGFLGTNYFKTHLPGFPSEILQYYDLPNAFMINQPQADGSIAAMQAELMDREKLAGTDQYAAFLQGNNGYCILTGNEDEGSILVIKDSFANCFVPYLTEHYQKIGVVDLRAWPYDLDELIAEGGYQDILVLYGFENFMIDMYAYRMQNK